MKKVSEAKSTAQFKTHRRVVIQVRLRVVNRFIEVSHHLHHSKWQFDIWTLTFCRRKKRHHLYAMQWNRPVQTILVPIMSLFHFSNEYYIYIWLFKFYLNIYYFKQSEMSTCNQKPKKRGGWAVQDARRCGTGLTAGEWFIFFWHYRWIMCYSKTVQHTMPIGGLNIKYVKLKENITLQKWYIELYFV